MAFFAGSPERGLGAHDDLAARIGNNAANFVEYHWRWEDMQGYVSMLPLRVMYLRNPTQQVFRLLLEYARVMSEDREAMSFHL